MKPHQLSGGEQQRAAIASRLYWNEPEILFLPTEPTGNLDSETATEIMELLLKIHRQNGPAIIIVTHNKSLMNATGRVFLFLGGENIKWTKGAGTGCGSTPS